MDDDVKELIEALNILERNQVGRRYQPVRDTYLKSAEALTRLSADNAESQELMAELFHAVNHKRDVWKTASPAQKVAASNDLNVAMENIKISKSYQSYRQKLSENKI